MQCFRCFVVIIFTVIYTLRLVCTVVFLSSTRPEHLSVSRRYRRRQLDSISHSLHVSCVFGFLLFIFLHQICPFLSISQHNSQLVLPFQSPVLIPHSSICPPLNNHYTFLLPSIYRLESNFTLSKRSQFVTRCLITLLLLLSGNVELNPGPVVIDPTVSFTCLNVRSASAITNTIDKPYLLQEFICDNSLDIFALTETWFQPDTPSNVINSVVPPGY